MKPEKTLSAEEIVNLVSEWGRSHQITDPIRQYAKVIEEAGEIAHELTRNNFQSPALVDAIGDTLVTVIILADILGIDPVEALEKAYNIIKDRSGHTDGNFIKEEQ